MKRISLLLVILFCIVSTTFAQNDFNAYILSNSSSQEGTARSVAMGNAFTALGGDLGSISINPASTGVYKFTEVGITPVFNTFTTKTDFYGQSYKNNRTTFGIGNIGTVFYIPTGYNIGLKNFNIGISMNKLANYNYTTIARNNLNTDLPTYLDHLATFTNNNFDPSQTPQMDINSENDPYSIFGGALWPSILGWNTSLINLNGAGTAFVPTEQLGISQKYKSKSTGYNTSTDLSFGFNLNDDVYLGANISMMSVWNKMEDVYSEDKTESGDFNYMDQLYYQKTSGSGIGAKFGIIVTPTPNIRFGAAISTPTLYYLSDRARWEMAASLGADYNVNLRTPELELEYKIVSPFRYNFGAAFVFPIGAISIDYEGVNYSQMKFRNSGDDIFHVDWSDINDAIKDTYKRSDKIRVGVEVNPFGNQRTSWGDLSLRAGFQYNNSGIKEIDIDNYIGSIGVGYSSPDGFFADLGFSHTLKDNDILYDGSNLVADYVASSASKAYKRSNWKLLLTLGFRF